MHNANNNLSPEKYLDTLLQTRGYTICKYATLQTGYYAEPTELQKASFSVHLIRLVRANDQKSLKSILRAGLSPNPCNIHGESLIHMICGRGSAKLLEAQLDVGGSVQVSDNAGRTPLHHTCRRNKPSFEMAEMILEEDLNLLHMADTEGNVPLSCVPQEHWSDWILFLKSKQDKWWPKKDKSSLTEQSVSPLLSAAPNSRPIRDPKNALSVEMATMVASGVIKPEDALLCVYDSVTDVSDRDVSEHDDEDDFDADMACLMQHLNKAKSRSNHILRLSKAHSLMDTNRLRSA